MLTVNIAPPTDATAMEEAGISAEIVVAIAAAVATFVGRKIRIRGLEQLHSESAQISRWSRQGRVLVQSSHNLLVKH